TTAATSTAGWEAAAAADRIAVGACFAVRVGVAVGSGGVGLVPKQSHRFCSAERYGFDEFALKQVEAIHRQMVEHVLEVADIPRFGKPQGVERLDEHPFAVGRRRRNAVPGDVGGKRKYVIAVFVFEQIDDHRSSRVGGC